MADSSKVSIYNVSKNLIKSRYISSTRTTENCVVFRYNVPGDDNQKLVWLEAQIDPSKNIKNGAYNSSRDERFTCLVFDKNADVNCRYIDTVNGKKRTVKFTVKADEFKQMFDDARPKRNKPVKEHMASTDIAKNNGTDTSKSIDVSTTQASKRSTEFVVPDNSVLAKSNNMNATGKVMDARTNFMLMQAVRKKKSDDKALGE